MCPCSCANFQRCPASGIVKLAAATTELAFERRKDAIKPGVFYGLPVAPILDTRADAHCIPRVKLLFFPRLWHVRNCIAQGTAKRKRNMHTHTHTHTERAANCYGLLINLCYRQNSAKLTPIGLRSPKKKKKRSSFPFSL